MKSLFWKIFVSFWLALIVFAGLTLWTTSHYLEKARSEANNARPRINTINYIRQARDIAQSGNIEAIRHWLKQLDQREVIPYLLLDQNAKDLLNRSVPLRLQQRVHKMERRYRHDDDEYEDDRYEHRRPQHRPIIINGQRYHLIPDFRSVTLSRVLNRPRVIATPILLAALVSAIVCLLLARYLTAPIGRLRQATQKLAQGDLNQRVSSSMGSRKDEIVELANDFDHMAEQLQNLIESHKQLLRDASHELRSPLARLQVALGLAQQRGGGKNTTELDRIERETERLNELIGQLLSLARMEAATTEIEQGPIELDVLLEEVADDAAYEAHAVNRDVKIIHSLPVTINGNSVLLSSALENVVRNAIRHTSEDTLVELSLQQDREKPGWIVIRVRDHGPGIPEHMLKSIFEPFVRVGEARDRQTGGHGLGLAIAKRAVSLHGGEMSAANEDDQGISILIHLPMNAP
jgi:two-component system sensor histidine kinase CpxA